MPKFSLNFTGERLLIQCPTKIAKMSDSEARIAELTARVAILEAAVKTGNFGKSENAKKADYPFLSKLSGEDKLAAETLIQENEALKNKVSELQDTVDQLEYRISHLKKGLDHFVKV